MKIKNDAYFTSKELAKYCIDKTYEILGKENISEVLEPSAGEGSFSTQIEQRVCLAYDIEPLHDDIIEQDFLSLDIDYISGRLIIGNPPYGRCMSLAQKFFKKSIRLGDYIAFILPISQLNNIRSLYEFDLIYSEDLGVNTYTDRELHCCFNIYKRPDGNMLNKKPSSKLEDVKIIRQDSKIYNSSNFDIRMCYWGDGTAGKILEEGDSYSAEYKIQITNNELRADIISFLKCFNWKEYLKCIAMRKIQQYHIVDVLKEEFNNIK